MSRIAVAVLGAVLVTTAAAPVTMPARSPAPGTPTARAQAPRVPVPAAELPEPTPNCPGLPAASRVSREPWAQRALGFTDVWPLTRGRGVTVAVVDSGVDFSRQLAGRVTAFDLTGTGLADRVGHGTAVAAIIAASDIQAQGMPFEGVAPAARILSVKVNSQETGSALLLAEGIRDAVLRGAQVINVSITTADTAALRSAVEFALSRNVVIVAAGGNDGTGTGTGPFYPASYPGVLSVGAVDSSGALAAFSDQQSHVAVTAPGVNVTSAFPGGYQQDSLTGTSYATPFVSGVAALVRSRYPRLSARQVVARIEATADGGAGPGTGNGLVNPVETVTAILGGGSAPSPSPSAAGPVSVSRTLPPDRTACSALEVAGGSLGVAALVAIGAVVGREGRRRRWRAGRERDSVDGGPTGQGLVGEDVGFSSGPGAVMGSDGMIGAGPGIAEGESGPGSNGATGFVGADDAATEPYGELPVTGGSGGDRRQNERYRQAWMAEDADIWGGRPHRPAVHQRTACFAEFVGPAQ